MALYPVKTLHVEGKNKSYVINVPGSKSISVRALLISALAEGTSILYHISLCDDVMDMIACLQTLGVEITLQGDTALVIGCGGNFPVKKAQLNVGKGGTVARFLTAVLGMSDGEYTLLADEQMTARPMQPLLRSLGDMGASFSFLGEQDHLPYVIKGLQSKPEWATRLPQAVTVDITQSSQFLSALLIADAILPQPVKLGVVGQHGMDYIAMTQNVMWSFGVTVDDDFTFTGGYMPKKYEVEPDMSCACYWCALARLTGLPLSVKGVMPHSMQGDSQFVQMIPTFQGGTIDMSKMGDQVLTLAVVAPFLQKPTRITGVAHLRGQESDRLHAIVQNLSALGVPVTEQEDGVTIMPTTPHGGQIRTFGDHRVAMAFAVLGCVVEGVVLDDVTCVTKSYPNFFEQLTALVEVYHVERK